MESSINSAIRKGFFQQIRYLLDFGLDVNERDDEKRTPLMNCSLIEEETWAVGIARMLLEYGALVRLKDNRGLNAFHYACIYEKTNLIKVYLSAIDFDLNAIDRLGNTPLHYVVSTGNEELLRTLLDALVRYKLPVDKTNKKGDTPLIHAYKTHNISCGDLLMEIGNADSSKEDVINGKSASELRQDAVAQLEDSSPTCFVKRPRTAFARLQSRPVSAPRQVGVFQRLARVPSAPTLRRHRSNNSVVDKENEEEKIISKNVITAKLYRSASLSDLRNKPEYILNVSPLTFFTAGNQYRIASKQGQFVQQEDGSWRFEMKSLYKKFDFQFTNSYRKSAKPPENGLHPMRALSPNCSDLSLDKNQKVGRRSSVKSPTNSELSRRSRVGSANPRTRRASMLSASSSNKSQLTTTDSSSSESVNSVTKQQKKKSRDETKDDGSDVSSHSSKSDKTKTSEQSRPPSRATHHAKDPVSNNHLDAIKE